MPTLKKGEERNRQPLIPRGFFIDIYIMSIEVAADISSFFNSLFAEPKAHAYPGHVDMGLASRRLPSVEGKSLIEWFNTFGSGTSPATTVLEFSGDAYQFIAREVLGSDGSRAAYYAAFGPDNLMPEARQDLHYYAETGIYDRISAPVVSLSGIFRVPHCFDIVFGVNACQRISDPISFLVDVSRLLKKGGIFTGDIFLVDRSILKELEDSMTNQGYLPRIKPQTTGSVLTRAGVVAAGIGFKSTGKSLNLPFGIIDESIAIAQHGQYIPRRVVSV